MNAFLTRYILPFGWFVLLTGMFWLWKRSTYHMAFNLFVLLPCVLILVRRSEMFLSFIRQPIFISFALFSAYMLSTLIWSPTDENWSKLIRAPLYIWVFMFSAGVFVLQDMQKMERVLHMAGLVAVLSALCSLAYFNYQLSFEDSAKRMAGYGMLFNPLLTSHVYGGFAVYWLVRWFMSERLLEPLPILCLTVLGILLVQTGSRTPFVGLVMALSWLFFVKDKKRALFCMVAVALFVLMQYKFAVSTNTWAGASYRPEIWMNALEQIARAPWFGHGYNAPLTVSLPITTLYDPHNIELAVMYEGGIVGLVLWVSLYICALKFSWQHRKEGLVLIASTWLVFGLGAGLTEGRSFMSRPKEHWFLIWIPMALLFASSVLRKGKSQISENKA